MPGIYGAVGCPPGGFRALHDHFERAWGRGRCGELVAQGSAVGGHGFGDRDAVHRCDGLHVAVDGAPSAFRAARRWSAGTGDPVVSATGDGIELHPRFPGNAAVLDPSSGVVHLAVDWAGAFPLYYARWRGGLVFCTLLRPLARVVEADVDPLGVLQFLRQGYVFGDRTPFRGVHRLRPGEVVRFEPEADRLVRRDRSRLWVGSVHAGKDELVERCLRHLVRALEETLEGTDLAVMMSGGWDSRTLLAAFDLLAEGDAPPPVRGYSHGDVGSRELALVRRLCRRTGVPCHLEPIDGRILDPGSLRRDFARTGTVNFPHWQRSGHVLRGLGVGSAAAGVFGEILGGHYGRTMVARGPLQKMTALAREWLGTPEDGSGDAVGSAWQALRVEEMPDGEHWYLRPEFERSIADKRHRINADVRSALSRLRDRGIRRPGRLLEAFVSEHRGSQYIAGQTVSLRAAVDAAVPFADRDLLSLASRIPSGQKVHNAINRSILESLESPLLDHPMAATLVPASAWMPLQEASRAVRKLWETAGWRGYLETGGRIPAPRLGWVNFEFLRDGDALNELIDDLRLDIWDTASLRDRVDRERSWRDARRLHPLFDQVGQILTVDLLAR